MTERTEAQATSSRHHMLLLWITFGLFCFRVAAQLIQRFADLPFLPPFATWQSGALPYPVLLPLQLVLIGVMLWLTLRIRDRGLKPGRLRHRVVLTLGVVYVVVMVFRLVAGLTVLSHSYWFAAPVPTFFHFVLATYLLTVGFHLRRRAREAGMSG
ncbi:MAG: hypothetical protein AB7N54_17210 [Alphaproteobacteria bacterium]